MNDNILRRRTVLRFITAAFVFVSILLLCERHTYAEEKTAEMINMEIAGVNFAYPEDWKVMHNPDDTALYPDKEDKYGTTTMIVMMDSDIKNPISTVEDAITVLSTFGKTVTLLYARDIFEKKLTYFHSLPAIKLSYTQWALNNNVYKVTGIAFLNGNKFGYCLCSVREDLAETTDDHFEEFVRNSSLIVDDNHFTENDFWNCVSKNVLTNLLNISKHIIDIVFLGLKS